VWASASQDRCPDVIPAPIASEARERDQAGTQDTWVQEGRCLCPVPSAPRRSAAPARDDGNRALMSIAGRTADALRLACRPKASMLLRAILASHTVIRLSFLRGLR